MKLVHGERVGRQARLRPGASAIIFDSSRQKVLSLDDGGCNVQPPSVELLNSFSSPHNLHLNGAEIG